MDAKTRINLGNTCECSIHVSLCNIIDTGLKLAIQNITTTIAASIANTDLFGKYEVDFLFILGNIFTIAPSSPLYTTYIMILQEAFEGSIAMKETIRMDIFTGKYMPIIAASYK